VGGGGRVFGGGEGVEECVDVDGFAEVEGVVAEAFGVDHIVLAGHEDDACLGIADVEEGGEGVSGDVGEIDVEEDGVGGFDGEEPAGIVGIGGGADAVAVGAEEPGQRIAGGGLIVNDEHGFFHGSLLVAGPAGQVCGAGSL